MSTFAPRIAPPGVFPSAYLRAQVGVQHATPQLRNQRSDNYLIRAKLAEMLLSNNLTRGKPYLGIQ